MTTRAFLHVIVLAALHLAALHASSQSAKPRIFTDGNKKFTYTDTGGVTASFIAHFGNRFIVDSLMTPGGETLILSEQPAVTVYNFWFVACKPCVDEIPVLNQLAAKYNNDSVRFIAITFDKPEKLEAFLTKNPFNFMIGILPQASIDKIKKISFYPFTAIVNRQHKISFVIAGKPVGKNPEKIIHEVLDFQIRKALAQ
jgi:thiol-disulfide isomerase/thioredoxin